MLSPPRPAHATANATHSGPPGKAGPPSGTGFDLILDQLHAQARTAPAEGQKTKTDTKSVTPDPQEQPRTDAADASEAPAAESAPTAPVDPQASADQAAPVAQPDQAAAPVATPAADATGGVSGASSTPQDGAAPPPAVTPVALEGAAGTIVAATPAATVTEGSPKPEVATVALEGASVAAGPASTSKAAGPASAGKDLPATGEAKTAATAAVATTPGAVTAPQQAEQSGADAGGAQAQPQVPVTETAAAPVVTAAPTFSGVQAAAPAAASVPTSAPVTTQAAYGNPLVHQVERIHTLVELAAKNGQARATLELHPADLGRVEIRLRTTANGLVATMTADRSDAVQALSQCADQLRRDLAEKGVVLHSLDFAQTSEGAQAGVGGFQGRGDAGGSDAGKGRAASNSPAPDDHFDNDELATATTVGLAPGALVDVRA